jgi:DNA ligase D-like protein (predicted ligase)
MLCTLIDAPFDDPKWLFEPKLDGLRVLACFDGRALRMISRNGKPQDRLFPEIAEGLRASLTQPAIVDGEVVCFDEDGRTSFRALQQRFHLASAVEIARRQRQHPASIYLFDLLYIDRYDVTGLPLSERKALLQKAVRWSDRVRWTDGTPGKSRALFRAACRKQEEGIVGKRLDSKYVAARTGAWVKIKCLGRQEVVIGGWTDPRHSRVGLGALLIGTYADDGQTLIYAGKVGTGFTQETLRDLRKQLDPLARTSSPFARGSELPRGAGIHWVEPRLVAEVAFSEWTQNGLLRHPRYEGLRPDKRPAECRRERPRLRASR